MRDSLLRRRQRRLSWPSFFRKAQMSMLGLLIVGIVVLACGAGWATSTIYWSPCTTEVDVPLQQQIPFSHKHHVIDDGIDCRYCRTSVEKSSFAGIPSTETCMTCHSQLWTDAPVLASLRKSLATGEPLKWARVNDLSDYGLAVKRQKSSGELLFKTAK